MTKIRRYTSVTSVTTSVTTRAAGEGLLTLHIPSTRTCKGDKDHPPPLSDQGPPPAHSLRRSQSDPEPLVGGEVCLRLQIAMTQYPGYLTGNRGSCFPHPLSQNSSPSSPNAS